MKVLGGVDHRMEGEVPTSRVAKGLAVGGNAAAREDPSEVRMPELQRLDWDLYTRMTIRNVSKEVPAVLTELPLLLDLPVRTHKHAEDHDLPIVEAPLVDLMIQNFA